ncbi:uncharacterized protein SCHCODRAFT_02180271 [Schizophyllum commune H4-8]|uniref:uncharacterized protein n=1 Tax=Schizophyllum commune (strain H4-8 / FGSC 9210) TaxID=578458 RepID=UPI00215EAAE9|nr:uncharacterized protein SCHCODRAFT_02180271 [Schizophyllum commune H4-8]KAI5895936.1 hypothetical protein SCHCODRAFT_02180271 [Schizophyllum commune H4-8]
MPNSAQGLRALWLRAGVFPCAHMNCPKACHARPRSSRTSGISIPSQPVLLGILAAHQRGAYRVNCVRVVVLYVDEVSRVRKRHCGGMSPLPHYVDSMSSVRSVLYSPSFASFLGQVIPYRRSYLMDEKRYEVV